jgi:hypothetical protein
MYPESRGPLSNIPNTGPAPIMMRAAEWLAVVEVWEQLAAHIEATPEATSKLGWVREMYAFSIAAALQVCLCSLNLRYRCACIVRALQVCRHALSNLI